MSRPLVLTFTAPGRALSVNETHGTHWAKVRGAMTDWHNAAWATANNARVRQAWPPLVAEGVHPVSGMCGPVPIVVHVTIPFRQTRRRDPHNYVGTVVKACVDGIVQARIVPDDNPDWVSVTEPTLVVVAKPAPLTCTITITERNPHHGQP